MALYVHGCWTDERSGESSRSSELRAHTLGTWEEEGEKDCSIGSRARGEVVAWYMLDTDINMAAGMKEEGRCK